MPEKDTLTPVRGRRLYKYGHTHRHGDDFGLFWCSPAEMERIQALEEPKVELAKKLEIDFEPDREETLEWEVEPLDSIQDISPEPKVGPGDPISFLRSIDWDLLKKQREALGNAAFRDNSIREGLEELLDGIQDLGTDTLT